ncbi:MAG: 4Fe-4S binding protein [Desulfobacteraceae bacterium]|nr:4Fe-4S binding protein [Desulfobacteraceae bacterium]
MPHTVYKELLEVMKKRGGDFSGMDIPEFFDMVEELFAPEEAAVNNAMPRGPFTAADLAAEMDQDQAEIENILEGMADKGLCMALTLNDTPYYQSARFMPGILEFQFMPGRRTERDKKLAKLIDAYKKAYRQKAGQSDTDFPTNRVIPVERTISQANNVHTYDQVQAFIDKNTQIAVSTCFCRHAAELRGEDIHGMPKEVCMQFGMSAQFAVERLGARKVSKQEAREVLERAEAAGLIHMSTNLADDIGFICNCDRWHCVAVSHALSKSRPGLFFNSGFMPRFDPELCTACETCIDRCPPEALIMQEGGPPVVDLDRCFGCAVCASGCPSDTIAMINRDAIPAPPEDAKALKAAIKEAKSKTR